MLKKRELQPRSSACLFWGFMGYIHYFYGLVFLTFSLKEMHKIEFDIFAKPLKPAVLKFRKRQNPWDRFARFSN